MNILIICKYASTELEGIETRIISIAKKFSSNHNANVTLVSSDSNIGAVFKKYKRIYNFEEISNINIIRIKTLKYFKTTSFRRILSWIDFEIKVFLMPRKYYKKPDVIIVSSLSLLTIINGYLLKKIYNSKLVFEIRDIWPLYLTVEMNFFKYNPIIILLAFIEKFGYKNADLIIGTMPNLKNHISSTYNISDKKIDCIPFGFDEKIIYSSNINDDKFITRDILGIPNNAFLIGFAGSMGIGNGLNTIFEVIPKFANREDIYFLFMGDGMLKDNYVKICKNFKNVIFLPKVIGRAKVAQVLSISDIVYFASLNSKFWDYGWSPNKIIDYMMAGKPILASYSGFLTMLNEADCGYVVKAEDPIALFEILNNLLFIEKNELVEKGLNGRKWLIENRSYSTLANSYYSLLEKII
jgi:glycosyltransferase involved in cell wall biosynthesis